MIISEYTTNELIQKCEDLLSKNGINYNTRGKSSFIVARKDLVKASELIRSIDPDYKVSVMSKV